MQEQNKTASNSDNQDAQKLKNIIVAALEDAKGNDIIALDVAHLTQETSYMIIVSGTSNRHIQTISETAFKKAQENGYEKQGTEGLGKSEWVVVDFGDIFLHVMSPTAREHYNIEGLWDISAQ